MVKRRTRRAFARYGAGSHQVKIGKLAIAVVLVPVAVYGGLKAYVYTHARTAVRHLIEQAAPLVAIEYRGIGSTLPSGTVQIEGLTFRPTIIPDTITVRTVVLRAGSLTSLLKLMRDADSRTPPESLSIAVQGASLNLDGVLASSMDQFLTMTASAGGMEPVAHCGNQQTVGFAFLRRLGYESLTMDMQVSYDIRKGSDVLTFGVDLNVPDMSRITMDAKVAGVSAGTGDFKTAQLKELGLAYKDLSYKDRVQRVCAQAAKISDAEYVRSELEQGAFQRAGIVPGPGLLDAYREFLTGSSSEVKVRAYPSEGFDAKAIQFYQPADVLQQLNAQVTVNNKRIDDLSFSFGKPTFAKASPRQETAATAPPPAGVAAVAKEAPQFRPVETRSEPAEDFRPVQVKDLSGYINQTVRLHPRGQPMREGVLMQIAGGVASVQRRFGINDVVYKIPLTSIERAEVLQ
jgi:hypothetical protein